jgi:hypothetical protein
MCAKWMRRRLVAALVLGLFWSSLTATVAAPLFEHNSLAPPVRATRVPGAPVRCVGTLVYLRTHALRVTTWPKVVITLDVTRADRCDGPFGRPVGRLHGDVVLTRDMLSVRTHLRTSQASPWVRACQWLRPDCLDVNAVVRWPRPEARP